MAELPTDTRVALGEILGSQKYLIKTMDGVVIGFAEFRKEVRDEQSAITERITKLEQFQWKLIGLATGGGVILPIVTSLIVWFVTKGT